MRNLAQRAAEAAKNTSGLIEDTVKKIRDGADLVERTNDAFLRVAGSATRVGELVGEIAEASGEQAHGIEQVNRAVAEMDRVTQQTAAQAQESAAASAQMTNQAHRIGAISQMLTGIIDGSGGKGAKKTVKIGGVLRRPFPITARGGGGVLSRRGLQVFHEGAFAGVGAYLQMASPAGALTGVQQRRADHR